MTIQQEAWWPDTCQCGIIQSYDDTLANPPISLVGFIIKDAAHSLLDDATAFTTILDEIGRKNKVLQGIINTLATQLSSTGLAGGTLKDGIEYVFTLTGTAPNRVLNITFNGINITNAQRRSAQTWCDNNIGVGKVVVQ